MTTILTYLSNSNKSGEFYPHHYFFVILDVRTRHLSESMLEWMFMHCLIQSILRSFMFLRFQEKLNAWNALGPNNLQLKIYWWCFLGMSEDKD